MRGLFPFLFLAAVLVTGETADSLSANAFSAMPTPTTSSADIPKNQTALDNDIDIVDSVKLSEPPKMKNKKPKSSTKTASRKKPTKIGISAPESDCLRRIREEYKDAIRMGICYDWKKQRLVVSANTVRKDPDAQILCLGPLATNLRHWHFSVRGVKGSIYESGIYHGRIILPKDYPFSPPRVQFLTPNGRFKTEKDICLSASNYHPESWTPRWTVLAFVHALRHHMTTSPQEIGGTIGSADEILEFARRSQTWKVQWRSGDSVITVDHAKLLRDGVLSSDSLDEDGKATRQFEQEQSPSTLSEADIIKKDEDLANTGGTVEESEGDEFAIEDDGTLQKRKSKSTKKEKKRKKTQRTEVSVPAVRGQQSTIRIVARAVAALACCTMVSGPLKPVIFVFIAITLAFI